MVFEFEPLAVNSWMEGRKRGVFWLGFVSSWFLFCQGAAGVFVTYS